MTNHEVLLSMGLRTSARSEASSVPAFGTTRAGRDGSLTTDASVHKAAATTDDSRRCGAHRASPQISHEVASSTALPLLSMTDPNPIVPSERSIERTLDATLVNDVSERRSGRSARRAYRLFALPTCIALAVLVFGSIELRHTLPDDAFILLVYVRHLVEEGSIFWNAEEGHVNGCTSILDLLLKSVVYSVTRSSDLLRMNWFVTLFLIGVVAAAGVGIFGALAKQRGTRTAYVVALTAAVAVAGHRAALEGAVFLLETPLYLVTVLGSVATLLFVRRWTFPWLVTFGLTCAAMMLARPEAVLLGALFLGYVVVTSRSSAKLRSKREFVAPAVAFGILAVFVAWHVHYFGYWAPNTYYAKKSSSRWLEIQDGIEYVLAFTHFKWGKVAVATIVLAPLLALARPWTSRDVRRTFLLLSGAGLLNLLSIVVAGGDCYFGMGRFLGCASILSIIALAIAAMHLEGALGAVALLPIVLLACGNVVVGGRGLHTKIERLRKAWPAEASSLGCDIEASRSIEALGISSFAQTDLQRFKFLNDHLRVIDASGLNDAQAAHESVAARVRWGKGGVAHAVRTNAEAFSYGYRFPYSSRPMAEYTARELVQDDALRDRFIGSHFGDAYPEPDAGGLLHANFRPASLRACGSWFNFWLRADIAQRYENREGLIVGRRDPEIVIPLQPGPGVRFEGFGPPESAASTTLRRAVGEGVVHLDMGWLSSQSSAAPCAVGVLVGPHGTPVETSLQGQVLKATEQEHRYGIPTMTWGESGELELRIRSIEPNGSIVLSGIIFETCKGER